MFQVFGAPSLTDLDTTSIYNCNYKFQLPYNLRASLCIAAKHLCTSHVQRHSREIPRNEIRLSEIDTQFIGRGQWLNDLGLIKQNDTVVSVK